jgi:ATP-dependent DNA helicase RecG
MNINVDDQIVEHFRLTPIQKIALKKLGLIIISDLLYHFPSRYGDTAEARNIETLQKGDLAVIYGKLSGLKTAKSFHTKITMGEGFVEDETGKIHCIWFNQPYMAKMYVDGMLVRIEGKVSQRQKTNQLYFSNPKIEHVAVLPTGVGDSLFGDKGESHTMYPVYPESRGISSLWLYHALQKIFKSGILDKLNEPMPNDILEKYHLPGIKTALIWIHVPVKRDDAISARKRFSFEEIFTIQLGLQKARKEYKEYPSFAIFTDKKYVHEFIRRFPFQATQAQIHSIETILADMNGEHAMSRLLEGDVGSGKTAVAAATAYAVINSKFQVAYMCPTEILAIQHFESFIQYFAYLGIQIGLITSSGCRKFPSKVNPKGWTDISRSQLLKWVENGEISIVIGTHSLIQKSVKFKHLACVIIDEQHRFGTNQRAQLVKKNSQRESMTIPVETATSIDFAKQTKTLRRAEEGLSLTPAPHLLSMTATPIPRTLALTMYGDLDLSLLDESPVGRKPIITEIVLPGKRDDVYEKIRLELQAGRQAYIICPRIDEPDPDKEMALYVKSVKEEAKRLKRDIFKEYEIGILHSRMTPKDKDTAMMNFKNGDIQILCATSVVEVGVNVPNATVIVIEGAERFGLAQLHQLRGRVLRSSNQAYCYAFAESVGEKSVERLKALQNAKNGFELAELDLAQRGAGELSGLHQWGVSDVAMEALKNLKMVEAARTEAAQMIEKDATLQDYPILRKEIENRKKHMHFE